jgi:hypothetical protein
MLALFFKVIALGQSKHGFLKNIDLFLKMLRPK